MSWSTSELRVRLAPLNRFKPSSKIFYLFIPSKCGLCVGGRVYVFNHTLSYQTKTSWHDQETSQSQTKDQLTVPWWIVRIESNDSNYTINTHYHKSNLIWRTVSRRVDEVIPSDHPRRVASRVIQWCGLIHETWYCTPDQVTVMIICLLYALFWHSFYFKTCFGL